jgi:hypothetical protein
MPPANYFPLLRVHILWNPPHPNLTKYIGFVLSRVRPERCVLEYALFLLLRAKNRLTPELTRSGHTLFFVAYMVAIKYLCDLGEYSAETWARWSHNVVETSELNRLEREFCAALDWNINVIPGDLKRFSYLLRHARSQRIPPDSMDWVKMPPVEDEPDVDYMGKVRDLGRRVKELFHGIMTPAQNTMSEGDASEAHELVWNSHTPPHMGRVYASRSRQSRRR